MEQDPAATSHWELMKNCELPVVSLLLADSCRVQHNSDHSLQNDLKWLVMNEYDSGLFS